MQKRFDSEYQGDVYTLVTSQDRIETTSGHPFWVTSGVDLESRPSAYQLESAENEGESISGRWLNASELEIGDTLFSKAGLHVTLLEIHSRHEDEFPVSNLSILYNPNFAVGNDQILVHNTNKDCRVRAEGAIEPSGNVSSNKEVAARDRGAIPQPVDSANAAKMARVRQSGLTGELAAGISGPKQGVLGPLSGKMRFPDQLTNELIESKNVARQGWTSQLKDYAEIA